MDYDAPAEQVINKWSEGYIKAEKNIPNDAQILLTRPYSIHPDDWYLSIVLAYLPENTYTPYVVWLCNASFGDTRFYEGAYCLNKWEAFRVWKEK
jgi:hypothetical protein